MKKARSTGSVPAFIAAALPSILLLGGVCAAWAQGPKPAARDNVAAETEVAEVAVRGDTAAREDVARFRERVAATLHSVGAEKGYWGVLVTDAASGEVLYALNAARYFTPASNTKLFTTVLALATLGPEFRIRTTIETTGTLDRSGRLQGDLVLVGRGDANLSNRVFPYDKKNERSGPTEKVLAEMADQVAAAGVKQITGDVIADDSYFTLARFPPGWTVDDTVWSYGAAVSAIVVNDNTLTIHVRPGANVGAPLQADIEPSSGIYSVHNTGVTSSAGSAEQLRLARDPDSNVFHISGTLPFGDSPRLLAIGVTQPAESAADLLARLLEARGVEIQGRARARHAEDAEEVAPGIPPNGRGATQAAAQTNVHRIEPTVLAEHISPALLEDVRLTNKLSENLHAELLLRVAARESGGAMTLDDAVAFASQFRQSIGLAAADVQLADGSGLSRNDLVTPESVVQLLAYASRQPWGNDFVATLPVVGEDGTLENRMKGTAAAGRIRAKTGTFDRADALSGYATTLRGERLIFSMFGNNLAEPPREAAAVLNAICIAMVEELGTAAHAASAGAR